MSFIKLHRELLDWEWFRDSKMVHLFLILLLKANHEDNNWRGIKIKRGQLVTGLHSLSSQSGISTQSIRTCIKRLKSTNEITIKSTNKYSIITICNYNKYQEKLTSYSTGKLTNEQQATNNQSTTNKNIRSIRSIRNKDNINVDSSTSLNAEEKYRRFVGLFNKISGRGFRGCNKSRSLFKARIKDGYKYNDFDTAITNLYADEYHKEQNYQYATPEFILRNDKLEMFLNKPKPPKPRVIV